MATQPFDDHERRITRLEEVHQLVLGRLDEIRDDLKEVRRDVSDLRARDLPAIRADVADLRGRDLAAIRADIAGLKEAVNARPTLLPIVIVFAAINGAMLGTAPWLVLLVR